MFKQITNFNNFNIYVGKTFDLNFRQETEEFKLEDPFITKIKKEETKLENINKIFNQAITEVISKNVYIIMDEFSEEEFLKHWLRCTIRNLV